MSEHEFAEAMRPIMQRIADWITENADRIEIALAEMDAEFVADVEVWLAAETAAQSESAPTPESKDAADE